MSRLPMNYWRHVFQDICYYNIFSPQNIWPSGILLKAAKNCTPYNICIDIYETVSSDTDITSYLKTYMTFFPSPQANYIQ